MQQFQSQEREIENSGLFEQLCCAEKVKYEKREKIESEWGWTFFGAFDESGLNIVSRQEHSISNCLEC